MADGAEPIAIGAPEERRELETTASLLTLADPDGSTSQPRLGFERVVGVRTLERALWS